MITRMIARADIMTMDILAYFSRYTLGGMTKAYGGRKLWIFRFSQCCKTCERYFEYWDVPIVVEAVGMEEEQEEEPMLEWGEKATEEWGAEPAEFSEEWGAESAEEWNAESVDVEAMRKKFQKKLSRNRWKNRQKRKLLRIS